LLGRYEECARFFGSSFVFDESPLPIFLKRNSQCFLCVHDYGTIPGDGFTNGLDGNQKKPHLLLLC